MARNQYLPYVWTVIEKSEWFSYKFHYKIPYQQMEDWDLFLFGLTWQWRSTKVPETGFFSDFFMTTWVKGMDHFEIVPQGTLPPIPVEGWDWFGGFYWNHLGIKGLLDSDQIIILYQMSNLNQNSYLYQVWMVSVLAPTAVQGLTSVVVLSCEAFYYILTAFCKPCKIEQSVSFVPKSIGNNYQTLIICKFNVTESSRINFDCCNDVLKLSKLAENR